MPTHVRSHSKINLGLAIGPSRADGFHALATLYQTLALYDMVTVAARRISKGEPSRITLTTNHPQVPTDDRNTAFQIVELVLTRVGISAEVSLHIDKKLPVQGGLGAGSANAAAALLGLERELGGEFTLSQADRLRIAAEVGSDVPLFLVGGAVLGSGRGEHVAAMHDLPATRCVVAVPEIGVSTPRAFQEWDGLCERKANASSGLTPRSQPDTLEKLSHVYASVLGFSPATDLASESSGIVGDHGLERNRAGLSGAPGGQVSLNDLAGNPLLALVRTGIENDFEQVVFPQYPLLREIKHLLMGSPESGAMYAALSGSGSALFGLYRNEADARAALQRVQASRCRALLTETLPRREYWGTMFAE
jgi:4-diphosphocytidyl-2-C-methyl-D-erythritol kinase